MIVEQFLKDIQKLIDRGTISPSAKVTMAADGIEVDTDDDVSSDIYIELNITEVSVHESSYNELVLIVD